ncbi:MAG: hypothetical protein KKB30_13010 [Proteobacteria bacterium]|nr:hypothetical protein [Pseudomonadota bacterium]MBU1714889.1 hypothetical protein [Pseudomonadota bacterium]
MPRLKYSSESGQPPKENGGIVESFFRLPWWFSFLLATFCYVIFLYIVPAFLDGKELPVDFTISSIKIAPILAVFFMLLGSMVWFRDKKARKNQNKQKPVKDDC